MHLNLERPANSVVFGAKYLWIALALGFVALGLSSCGTDAVGVSACREIESARCEAAHSCPNTSGIGYYVDDVDACKRYTRDHCLHGTGTDKNPGPSETAACARVISEAGNCAKQSPGSPAPSCSNIESENVTVCDLILQPEKATACAFLTPDDDVPATSNDASTDGGS